MILLDLNLKETLFDSLVGKTYIVNKFDKANYRNVIYVNFEVKSPPILDLENWSRVGGLYYCID